MHRLLITLTVCLALAITSSTPGSWTLSARAAPSTNIRVGIVGAFTWGLPVVAKQKGWFSTAGLNVELTKVPSGPAVMEALAGGHVDIGVLSSTAFLSGIARDAQVEAIALAPDATSTYRIQPIVKASIKGVGDLRRKTIMVPFGTASHLYLILLLDKFGLKASDVNLVNASFADAQAAFASGRVDAAIPLFTQILRLEAEGVGHLLTTDGSGKFGPKLISLDKAPGKIIKIRFPDLYAANRSFALQNANAAQRFVQVLMQAHEWGKRNPDQAMVELLNWQNTEYKAALTDSIARELMDGIVWVDLNDHTRQYFNPAFGPGSAYSDWQAQLDFLLAQHVISKMPDLKTFINPKFVEELSKRKQ